MNVTPETPSAVSIRPPQLIQSLVGGFNAVASHIYLIFLPLVLDIFLWFGPHIRIKALMEPTMLEILNFSRLNGTTEMRSMLDQFEELWKLFLDKYNLLSTLSTFPVGIPSLMSGQLPGKTPLGAPAIYEVNSFGQFLLTWLGLTLLGFILGSLYFAMIAQVCRKLFNQQNTGLGNEVDCGGDQPAHLIGLRKDSQVPPLRLDVLMWETIQVIALMIILLGILFILMVPATLIASLLAMVSPIIAQIALLLVSFTTIWFMVPLIFSPHGIFYCRQHVFKAMLNSIRLVRYLLPGTGLFLISVIILNQGLDLLWRTPPDQSWMALVGIFGHSFVITGLLAASFVYYRNGLVYIQAMRKLRTM